MRYFNTAGPCDPEFHYTIPAAERLPEARRLAERGMFFVVHAPRQTGKTTTLHALARELTAEGRHAALHFSCESGEPAGDDVAMAEDALLHEISLAAILDLPPALRPPQPWPQAPQGQKLRTGLGAWAQVCPLPLVLVLDEIDALRGRGLISVLRQLRAGYPSRPGAFPASIILCGLRDVRDYKAASGGNPSRLGTASPFNIKVESLKLGSFTKPEVAALYAQHTHDTGQEFESEAVDKAFELTLGQPWLVNALAREVVEKIGVPPSVAITAAHVQTAADRLIVARATHLDSLVARLSEPRVRRILEPMLAGNNPQPDYVFNDDALYLRDLGLIAPKPPLKIANPIYNEVIVRVLAAPVEDQVYIEPRSFVGADGRLDMPRLLTEFIEFWKEHGDNLAGGLPWQEVAAQLVLMAFLQRVVNGGGHVEREYGVGRGRIDLLVHWPVKGPRGNGALQREAMELKVWAPGRPDPLKKGLDQIDSYLARLSLKHGILMIFDRRPTAVEVEERCSITELMSPLGKKILLVRV